MRNNCVFLGIVQEPSTLILLFARAPLACYQRDAKTAKYTDRACFLTGFFMPHQQFFHEAQRAVLYNQLICNVFCFCLFCIFSIGN